MSACLKKFFKATSANEVCCKQCRTVNYHNTLAKDRLPIRDQLTRLAARFQTIALHEPAALHELAALVAGEPWSHPRPPLLLVFYEGFRNHIDVAAPLLAELGLKGIFCLIPGFNDAPSATQFAFGLMNYTNER